MRYSLLSLGANKTTTVLWSADEGLRMHHSHALESIIKLSSTNQELLTKLRCQVLLADLVTIRRIQPCRWDKDDNLRKVSRK
jgi:hypothetical protein